MKMKKNLFLISALALFTLNLAGQNSCLNDLELVDSLYYLHGQIYQGAIECYDKKGVLRESGHMEQGLLDSIIIYNRKGEMEQVIWYEDNQVARYRLINKFFSTSLVTNHQGDSLHGQWAEFFRDGKMKEEHHYEMGEPVGIWKVWDKEGRILKEIDFDSDPVVGRYHTYKGGRHLMSLRVFGDKSEIQIRKPRVVGIN
jgi:antitoxin component YwqK of YwqJK toxin-antitoxin module